MKKPKSLKITYLGNKVLRHKAKSVKQTTDKKFQDFIDNLILTCKTAKGVGIAAPQVNKSARVMIVWSHPNKRYPKALNMKPVAMINPRILKKSNQKEKDWEGCLSIPGIRGLVPRYKWVEVEYVNRKGEKVREKLSDSFVARIFQHELDHLNGVLFIDRTKSRDLIGEQEYQKLIKKN